MKTIALLISLTFAPEVEQQADDRLDQFITRLEAFFKARESVSEKWSMPNFLNGPHRSSMPMGRVRFFDHETKLEYSPITGKIYAPDLKIGYDVVTETVHDFATRRTYNIDELRPKKYRKQT